MEPVILHSTSWRHDGTEVVLSYLAVVTPGTEPPLSWEAAPIGHVELARGDATTPPSSIGTLQVLEHALRHLAWLMKDDEVVAKAIPDWAEFLSGYVPEPFRAFGTPFRGGLEVGLRPCFPSTTLICSGRGCLI